MRYGRYLLACMAAALFLSGCESTAPKRDLNDPTNSLVFAYIDMTDAPNQAQSATIEQVAPPTKWPYWHTGVHEGLFYRADMPPGSYQVTTLFGSGFFSGDIEYRFPRQGNETSVRITRPGIYFLGAYKYHTEKSGFMGGARFSIDRVKTPSEADLLKRLLKIDKLAQSSWGDKVRARLAQLKQ